MSITRRRPIEAFGFTEAEVEQLLDQAGRSAELPDFQRWYNGYDFGGHTVYNPWSILHALKNPAEPLQAWWLGSSANTLVRKLLLQESALGAQMEELLRPGGFLEAQLSAAVPLSELNSRHIWSLLLHSGYLKIHRLLPGPRSSPRAELTIPNLELQSLWRDTFLDWLDPTGAGEEQLPLHRALLRGDAPGLQVELNALLRRHVSAHDTQSPQVEAFYHAFMLGLLVSMEPSHLVRSNRESGLGRADLLLIPRQPGQPGAVLEFKRQPWSEGRALLSLPATAAAALRQVEERGYTAELEAAGAAPIHRFGIGFAGREAWVLGPEAG
jgi:hypothetical protein